MCVGGGANDALHESMRKVRAMRFHVLPSNAPLAIVLPSFEVTRGVLEARGIFTVGQLRGLAPSLAIGRCFIKDHLSFLSPTNVFTVLAAMSRETLSVKALARTLLEGGGISRGSESFTPAIFTAAAMAILAAEN
jgi:hypothetical protein